MDNFMAIIPMAAIGLMGFIFLKFIVDVIRGKYRTEE